MDVGFIVLATVLKFVLFVLVGVMGLAAVLTWFERRQSAFMQDRRGPERAHFFKIRGKPVVLLGLLHIAADGLKMFFKEMFIPQNADRGIFRIAPLIGFATGLVIVALIPFGPDWHSPWGVIPLQIARVDAGLLFIFAIGSLGVYGATLAGWASNNRFGLLGGLRASAQGISYEIALGLTVVGVLLAYGATELSAIVDAQEGTFAYGILPRWGFFAQPFGAVLFLVAGIAETKRSPFDLPEGESEIIGYFVEYSSMGFGLFMLGEFIEIVVLAALVTTLFFGGWQLPWILTADGLFLGFASFTTDTTAGAVVVALAGMAVFALKVVLLSLFQLQLRWTLPRFRYDQLMRLGWKVLLPLALLNIFVTAIIVWIDPSLDLLYQVGVAIILLFALVVIAGPKRTVAHAPSH